MAVEWPESKELKEKYPDFMKIAKEFAFKTLEISGLDDHTNFLVLLGVAVAKGNLSFIEGCVLRAIEHGVSVEKLKGACIAVSSLVGYPAALNALNCINDLMEKKVKIASAGRNS